MGDDLLVKSAEEEQLVLDPRPADGEPGELVVEAVGFFRQSVPQMSGFFSKLLNEFRIVLFSAAKTLPCQALLPDLVTMFTTEPELRPYSGPNWLVTRTYWETNSASVTKSPGPPTLLSLLF